MSVRASGKGSHLGGGGALLRTVPLRAEGGTLLTAVEAVDWCNDREGFGNSCFMAEGSLPPSVIIAVDEPGVRSDLEIEPPAAMPGRDEPKGAI